MHTEHHGTKFSDNWWSSGCVNKIHHDHEDLGSNIFANILIMILGLLKRAVSLEWGGSVSQYKFFLSVKRSYIYKCMLNKAMNFSTFLYIVMSPCYQNILQHDTKRIYHILYIK